jgi:Flp pilus assembly protein TadG
MQKLLNNQQGSTLLEMTLVGIPLIFILISTFDVALGMWGYDTLAYSVRETTRYATVHGQDCTTSPNSCGVTVGTLAHYLSNAAIGVPSGTVNVSFVSLKDSITCSPLSSCFSNNNTFPSSNANGTGDPITVTATYPFKSAIAMFWPGSAPVQFGTVTFYATSTDNIQF